MRFIVEHPDGRREEASAPGENMALGLGGALLPCLCGKREFVDTFSNSPPESREPDRDCDNCGRKYWYYDDPEETSGGLTPS